MECGVNSPVQEAETFRTLAEIAIALAGFTGIVAVLGRRVRGEWTPLEWARLRDLLLASLGVVFFAFIPELLYSVIPELPTVWRISSGFFALYLSVLITCPARNDWPLGDRMEARRHGLVTRTSTDREPGGIREPRKCGHSANTKFRTSRLRRSAPVSSRL
jgi:hypothetical protein